MSSKITVYETFGKEDIEALLDAGIYVALAFDASHTPDEKSVHLELAIDASAGAIANLKSRSHGTYIKLKAAFIHGEGTFKLVCHHFEQDIVDASPKSYEIRKNRAIVRRGEAGDFVPNIGWW